MFKKFNEQVHDIKFTDVNKIFVLIMAKVMRANWCLSAGTHA